MTDFTIPSVSHADATTIHGALEIAQAATCTDCLINRHMVLAKTNACTCTDEHKDVQKAMEEFQKVICALVELQHEAANLRPDSPQLPGLAWAFKSNLKARDAMFDILLATAKDVRRATPTYMDGNTTVH